jgi:murein DD-endopeptidase MepM/ murein hydrolase activator NlpD
MLVIAAVVVVVLGHPAVSRAARALPAGEPESYIWPVVGPVLRGFEPPDSRFTAGHRGIDIGAPLGTSVRAAAAGTVAFAGSVAGSRFVSIDHADGVRTTYSWLSVVSVGRGAAVGQGEVIGATGHGHPAVDRPHLHFGARLGEDYLDPMILLGVGPRVHLAPLEAAGAGPQGALDIGSARGLPAPPPPAQHWLWSRAEPKPLVLPGRGPPA